MRPRFPAGLTAAPTASMSLGTHRASPQITGPLISRAMVCTDKKSPSLLAGKPASITSTFSRANCRAISNFSRKFMEAPGHCSPSRNVVSNIIIWFFFIILIFLSIHPSHESGLSYGRPPSLPAIKKPHRLTGRWGLSIQSKKLKPQPPRGEGAARSATVEGSNSSSRGIDTRKPASGQLLFSTIFPSCSLWPHSQAEHVRQRLLPGVEREKEDWCPRRISCSLNSVPARAPTARGSAASCRRRFGAAARLRPASELGAWSEAAPEAGSCLPSRGLRQRISGAHAVATSSHSPTIHSRSCHEFTLGLAGPQETNGGVQTSPGPG